MASILSRYTNKKTEPKKTISEHAEDALYREITEEVKAQETYEFIKKHAKILIAGVVLILLIVAGITIYHEHATRARTDSAAMYEVALNMVQTNPTGASAALLRAANESTGGMSDLALFDAAKMDLSMGKAADAATKLKQLARDGATGDFRDLAVVYLGVLSADSMTPDAFAKFMSPVQDDNSPFYYTGLLFVAEKYLSAGDEKNANIWLNKILNDRGAPAEIRTQAEELR